MDEMYGTMEGNGQAPMYGNGGCWQGGPSQPQEDVRTIRRHFSKLGGLFTAGAVLIYAVQLIPMFLVSYLRPEWMRDANISLILSVMPMYLVGMPILILLLKLLPGEKVEGRPMGAGKFIMSAVMCFALMYIFNILGTLITTLIGLVKGGTVDNEVANMTASISMVLILIYMVICAPVFEEIIFRKLIVERTVRYGQGVAVMVSGLMFGLFHGNLNQFMYAFALGMFLAFLYVKTGNIKITIGLHMMVNFVGGFLSSGLMRMLDLDQYMWVASTGDMELMMNFIYNNLLPLLLYLLLALFVVGMIIGGGVLFIVAIVKNKFTFAGGTVTIPKGKRFRTVVLNAGMLCYGIFWIGMIILQLLS